MDFENNICLSYLGCSSSFDSEFITHEQLVTCTVYMPQGRAHRYMYIHLIYLQGQVSTGQTQIQDSTQVQ